MSRLISVGGLVSELSGGDFLQGAAITAVTVGSLHYYRHVTGIDPHLTPGKSRSGTDDYSYIPEDGKIPSDQIMYNISGVNATPNDKFFHDLMVQGGPVSNFVNYAIPGGHGLSVLHDNWLNGMNASTAAIANVPTMIPAAAIHTLGLIGTSSILQNEVIRQTID